MQTTEESTTEELHPRSLSVLKQIRPYIHYHSKRWYRGVDVEDAFSDVQLKVLLTLKKLPHDLSDDSLLAYLRPTVRNAFRDRLRFHRAKTQNFGHHLRCNPTDSSADTWDGGCFGTPDDCITVGSPISVEDQVHENLLINRIRDHVVRHERNDPSAYGLTRLFDECISPSMEAYDFYEKHKTEAKKNACRSGDSFYIPPFTLRRFLETKFMDEGYTFSVQKYYRYRRILARICRQYGVEGSVKPRVVATTTRSRGK